MYLSKTKLVDLVLAARNQTRGDSVHVKSATELVEKMTSKTTPVVSTPTPVVVQPTQPTQATQSPKPTTNAPTEQAAKTNTVGKPDWLGEWSGNIAESVKSIMENTKEDTVLLVAYNIPGRDNGNYSAGGLHSAEEYTKWIFNITAQITKPTIVVLEPDALGLSRSLSDTDKSNRYAMLNSAVSILKSNPRVRVYIDSSTWAGVSDSVSLLNKIKGVDGFSCNVSGYEAQTDVAKYADEVAKQTGLRYICDTSRNGNGQPHPGRWCNSTLTRIGLPNTMSPTQYCDAYLWIKVPGESDGKGINDDGSHPRDDVPSAGTMWPEYRDAIYSGDWTAFNAKYKV